ncbi:MAG: TetR/AcrR family transcriptional regulator [Brachybacterium sp.]|uniref:TetR/AcrR family transcriptional regulator n=1 Tax=Brachybacterium sp. TaxID=1891286 RepID=UPI0026499CC0|nr:TetR/AcrR family transcriptional regulator [Brachybacterium sp.]MDN5685195.1 TetR/AcrR family transcriptional regulator [Brachybacterium sp.]
MRADAREKRRAILEAAWRLIAENGPDVPMRTVALEARVGFATLYRHFPTPEDLILGLVDVVFDRVEQVIDEKGRRWDENPAASWEATVLALAELEFGALAYQLVPATRRSDALRSAILPRQRRTAAVIARLLERAAADGLVGGAVQAPQFFIGLAAISRPLPAQVDEVAPGQRDWMVRTYIAGLRPAR